MTVMCGTPGVNDSFLIEGGIPLNGEIEIFGNKNAVLPMIAASLLTEEPVVLENVPEIDDVYTMLEIVQRLGVLVDWDKKKRELTLCAETLTESRIAPELCSRIRASILVLAPLLVRLGHAEISPPGGDIIGSRRLDTHFYGLEKLGAEIELGVTYSVKRSGRLTAYNMFLSEAGVTATEQLIMAAVAAEGVTTIRNAACEPHVVDMIELLRKMGAKISGAGSNIIEVEGVERLNGARHRVGSDYTEAGSFLALGAATGGQVTVKGIDPTHYWMTIRVFERLGVPLEFTRESVTVRAPENGRFQMKHLYGGGIPKIDDGPWPHFPSDLMSVMILLATQVEGTVLFFEKMYEGRMYFVDRLNAMGADTVVCDPHRVVVCGPSRLRGIELTSPDIRAGVALLGAALCAHGKSVIRHVHLIDRGYEMIHERLQKIGARIERCRG